MSGRLYFSYGAPLTLGLTRGGLVQPAPWNAGDPNASTLLDWSEFTYDAGGLWLNSSQVDQFAIPHEVSVTGADGVARTRRGEPLSDVLGMVRGVDQVVAVGVNCTDPASVVPAVVWARVASGKPVVVYPNSGESWDADARAWTGTPGVGDVTAWLSAGARLVGGCCRVALCGG